MLTGVVREGMLCGEGTPSNSELSGAHPERILTAMLGHPAPSLCAHAPLRPARLAHVHMAPRLRVKLQTPGRFARGSRALRGIRDIKRAGSSLSAAQRRL
jgi:hypothetical protein